MATPQFEAMMKPPVRTRARVRLAVGALVVGALGVTLAGCGDDEPAAQSGDVDAYCALVAEISSAGGAKPSDAQMDRLLQTAPSEVRADVSLFVKKLRAATDQDAFLADPAVVAVLKTTQAFEQTHCS